MLCLFSERVGILWWTLKVTGIQEGSPISVVIALTKLSAIATIFILPSPLVSGIDSWYH